PAPHFARLDRLPGPWARVTLASLLERVESLGRLGSGEVDILRLLAIGVARQAIATRLHISPRTVALRIRAAKQVLRTRQRVCLGFRAIRAGYVSPDHVLDHTRPPGGRWVGPDHRQHSVLLLLVAGTTMEAAASAAGVGLSTARGVAYRLAHDNGAATLIHLGTLAAALR